MAKVQPTIQILSCDGELGLPVVIGVPLERGSVRDASALSLTSPSGKPCPLGARALVTWPDGSIRWALLATQATEAGPHRLNLRRSPGKAPVVKNPVKLAQSPGRAVLDNGLVKVVLADSGPGPIHEITALGHAYLARPEDLRLVVNAADTTREPKRTIQVLEQSPLRTRVRVSGAHFDAAGKRLLNYRLDIELWAGWATLRLDYHFFNLEPGREQIDINRMALEWDIALEGKTQRHFLQSWYGLAMLPREVFNPAPVAIVTDEFCGPPYVQDAEMLRDDTKYPSHLRPPLVATEDWLGVGDGRRSLYMKMQDFIQMRPKRLSSSGTRLGLEIWPAYQGTLKLPQGRSRRQVVTVAFSDRPHLEAAQVQRLLEGPLHEDRAVVAPDWVRRCGEFDADRMLPLGANARFEKYFGRLVRVNTPQDIFDLGDTIDSGYCRTYLAVPNNLSLKRNAPALPRVYLASMHSPFAEWAMPQMYEPVWTNNEYDVIHVLCSEILRTGRGDLLTMARWFARHNIEVDFVHYHDDLQQNRATPQHSARHNRSGSIPSHYWTQGLLQYYCMTGDADVLEIAVALGDKIIEDFTVPSLRDILWSYTRELGWPSVALAHLYDITREERFARQLEEIVNYFISYGKSQSAVGLDDAARGNLSAQSAWSMIEGADRYQRLTGRKDVKAWLVEVCEVMRQQGLTAFRQWLGGIGFVQYLAMSIGYELTGDKRYLKNALTSMEELMENAWWASPIPEAKPAAIMYRGLPRLLFHMHRAGLLDRFEYPSLRQGKR